jgi:hypothetical protein
VHWHGASGNITWPAPCHPFIVLAASACANYGTMSAATVQAMKAGDYRTLGDRALCVAFDDVRRCAAGGMCSAQRGAADNVRAAIDRRHLVAMPEWPAIEAGSVVRGMSECAALAAWGEPLLVSDSGPVTVMQFRAGRVVVFTGGKVTSVTAVSQP